MADNDTLQQVSNIEKLYKLFEDLEKMMETRTLTKKKLEKFWEDASKLAEADEEIDKEMLDNMKTLMIALTSEMEFKVERNQRSHTIENSLLSFEPVPDQAQVNKIKPMLVLWGGFFVGTAVSVVFLKKPLNFVNKTILTTFVAKAAEKGFDKAYEEFQKMEW